MLNRDAASFVDKGRIDNHGPPFGQCFAGEIRHPGIYFPADIIAVHPGIEPFVGFYGKPAFAEQVAAQHQGARRRADGRRDAVCHRRLARTGITADGDQPGLCVIHKRAGHPEIDACKIERAVTVRRFGLLVCGFRHHVGADRRPDRQKERQDAKTSDIGKPVHVAIEDDIRAAAITACRKIHQQKAQIV